MLRALRMMRTMIEGEKRMNADSYRIMNKGREVGKVATERKARKAVRGKPGYFYLPIHYTRPRTNNLVNEYPNGSDADMGC